MSADEVEKLKVQLEIVRIACTDSTVRITQIEMRLNEVALTLHSLKKLLEEKLNSNPVCPLKTELVR